jgi:hypothetical protein
MHYYISYVDTIINSRQVLELQEAIQNYFHDTTIEDYPCSTCNTEKQAVQARKIISAGKVHTFIYRLLILYNYNIIYIIIFILYSI